MKKALLVLIVLLSIVFYAQQAAASHVAGGEITYKWLRDSTYYVTFTFYRACSSGTSAPASVPLCYRESCHGYSNIQYLPKLSVASNGSQVSVGCSSFPTNCDDTHSTLNGFQEWIYADSITLPNRCSRWVFSVEIDARNTSLNLTGSGSAIFYVESTLNNVVAQGNSSPTFTVKPVPYVCINTPYTFNNGASDINNDSLSYEILNPKQESADCQPPTSIPFNNSGSVTYDTLTNPLACANTFVLDPLYGQMSFTPNTVGQYTLTVRTNEYRSHILIGSTMRDVQVQVLQCNIPEPVATPDTSTVTIVNGRIIDCLGGALNFCFNATSSNTSAKLTSHDNHLVATPGATVTYTGLSTSHIRGCFSWVPTGVADTGLKVFTVSVVDSTCAPPGITESVTYSFPIYIYSNVYATPDTSLCRGSSITLAVAGGSNYTWTVLPGGAPVSTLSCTNCTNPVVDPAITTSYVVTSSQTVGCANKDTVKVTVNAIPAKPTPTSNSPVCANDTLRLYAGTAANSYLWTGPAGFNSGLQNVSLPNIQVPNTGWYHVRAKNGYCISAPDSVYALVTASPGYPVITGNGPICSGSTLSLSALSNTGANYTWSGPNGYTSTAQNVTINNASTSNSGLYSVFATYPANAACKSPVASYNVVVNPAIQAGFQFSKDTICKGDIVYIIYSTTADSAVVWNFNGGVPKDTLLKSPIPVAFPAAGTETITLNAFDTGCHTTVQHDLHVFAAPPATFTAPPACFGSPVTVIADHVYDADVTFTWNFGSANVLSGSGAGPYVLQYSQPGSYQVTLVAQNPTCTSPLVANTVIVYPIPDATITTSNISNICSGDKISFSSPEVIGYHYNWQPQVYFTNDTVANTYAYVKYNGYFYQHVTDNYGCKAADSVYLETRPCCIVSLPNAFTPNNDGKNDLFRIITIGHHDISYFRIFNRWGQTVYSSTDESAAWNGKSNGGVPCDGGMYYYAIRYKCADGETFEQKGEVMLVR